MISEAKLSDSGTYICVARNRVSNTEITAYLHIGKGIIIDCTCRYVCDLMHITVVWEIFTYKIFHGLNFRVKQFSDIIYLSENFLSEILKLARSVTAL